MGPFTKVYRENDTSAFKKRKVIKLDGSINWIILRPEFRQLLAGLALPASCPTRPPTFPVQPFRTPPRAGDAVIRVKRPVADTGSPSDPVPSVPSPPGGRVMSDARVGQRLASSASVLSR